MNLHNVLEATAILDIIPIVILGCL